MKTEDIPVGVSNRHVHLSRTDLETLFGSGYCLDEERSLRQPGQFAAEETVTVVGPKGRIDGVRIIGPVRRASQVEISRTDAFKLGIKPPVRPSGRHEDTPGVTLIGPEGSLALDEGAILAQRHIHMHPEDAERLGVRHLDEVSVKAKGPRAAVLEKVIVRVDEDYALELHLDTDEANATLLKTGDTVTVVRPEREDPRLSLTTFAPEAPDRSETSR